MNLSNGDHVICNILVTEGCIKLLVDFQVTFRILFLPPPLAGSMDSPILADSLFFLDEIGVDYKDTIARSLREHLFSQIKMAPMKKLLLLLVESSFLKRDMRVHGPYLIHFSLLDLVRHP